MTLNFPRVADIRLAKSPLTEVICQVRFPPILRIEAGLPSTFQDLVRERFPLFEVEQGLRIRVSASGMEQSADAEATTKLFRFRTIDEQTSITLGIDAYALSTNRYTVWSDFAADLALAHTVAQRAYRIPFHTRIGLRYVNLLTLANTGRESLNQVAELLRPELTVLLATDAWSVPAQSLTHLILDDNGGKLGFRVGFKTDAADDGPAILLDFDYYEEGHLPVDDLLERTDRYHDVIYRAFRWSLNSNRLAVFEPAKEGDDASGAYN